MGVLFVLTTLKSIVRRIDTLGANIIYYEQKSKHSPSELIYFYTLSENEQKVYEELTDTQKKSFVGNSAAIYIPRMTITEFYEDYSTVDPYTIEYTLDMVFSAVPQIKGNASLYPDAFALFCILHELGHWNHFLHCCKKVYDYISDSEIRKKYLMNNSCFKKSAK